MYSRCHCYFRKYEGNESNTILMVIYYLVSYICKSLEIEKLFINRGRQVVGNSFKEIND